MTSPTPRRSVPAFRSRGQRNRWHDNTTGIPGSAFSGNASFLAPEAVPSSSRIHPRGSTSGSHSRELDNRGIRATSHRHSSRPATHEGSVSNPRSGRDTGSGALTSISQRPMPLSLDQDLIDLSIDNDGTIPGGFTRDHAMSQDDDTSLHSDDDGDNASSPRTGSPSRPQFGHRSSRSPFKWIAENYRRWGTPEGNGNPSGSGGELERARFGKLRKAVSRPDGVPPPNR